MGYLTENAPARGTAIAVAPGIRRLVAPNPGPMTYHGTNTYLIDGPEGTIVLDPGPENAAHHAALLAATDKVAAIWVSHTHHDHVAGLPALRAATGAPVFAHAHSMTPDHIIADGDMLGDWQALHTPGHAADHLCFARADGVVFTADHVMGWSSSIVSPPDGDMAAYFASLHRLLARQDTLYLPGHGPPITTPLSYARFLLAHRLGRENAIVAALEDGPHDAEALVDRLYAGLAPHLRPAARRNVQAHLLKLSAERRVTETKEVWTMR